MIVLPAVLALAALGSVALAAEHDPLKGGWVAEGVSCSALGTYLDERILKIGDRMVEFYEAECAIRSANRDGTAYTLQLLCEAEGQTERSTFEATLRGSDRLSVKGGFDYVRCR